MRMRGKQRSINGDKQVERRRWWPRQSLDNIKLLSVLFYFGSHLSLDNMRPLSTEISVFFYFGSH